MNFTIGSVYTRIRPRKRYKQTNRINHTTGNNTIPYKILHVLQTLCKEDYSFSIGYIITEYYSKKSLKEKYDYINSVVSNNLFFSESLKTDILLHIYKFQHIVKCFNTIKQRFQLRKIKIFPCEESFDCTPFKDIHASKKIRIIELNTAYDFRTTDLLKVCVEHLTYSEYLISTPKKPKNPFTNIILSDHNIYNLYIKLKRTNYNIPLIFESYIKYDLNLRLLYEYNDINLNWLAAVRYVDNMDQLHLLNHIHTIFNIYTNLKIKLQRSQNHKDYIIEFFKSSIYCDCFIVHFEPSSSILHQKTNIITRNLNSFIMKHPSWIEKKRERKTSRVDTQRSNTHVHENENENENDSDSDDTEEYELTEITSF